MIGRLRTTLGIIAVLGTIAVAVTQGQGVPDNGPAALKAAVLQLKGLDSPMVSLATCSWEGK